MKKTLKRTAKLLALGSIMAFVSLSCSKDDDPTDNDLFIGKYKGHITYTKGDTHIDAKDGHVEVVKVGKDYNFIFSDKIPNLTGVKFEKEGENTVINIGSDEAHLIKIDASTLFIAYAKDGEIWSANCSR
ncbi:hypothetical protein ACKUSY_02295 [Myroides odoratus]